MRTQPQSRYIAQDKLVLQLYVSGMSPKSLDAINRVKHLCDENLEGTFELEIIDLYKRPEAASEQQIVFSPSLVKKSPLPRKTLVGDLSNVDKVIKGLGLIIKD